MAVLLSPVGGVAGQFFDNNGNPLTGGKLYSYVAGTTTPQATYTSSSGVTAHSNPIILDAGGRVPGGEIWLTDGLQYKFVLKNANDVLIGTYDNIIGINSNFVNFLTETEVQTATAGQTVFTLTTMQYQPGTNNLSVYVDGVNQIDGSTYSYVETSSTVVTFTAGLHVGALVKFTTAQTLSTGVTDASLVTYTPAGTGAVATDVQTKLRESISVEDFGVIGDGITDDTAAMQLALDAGAAQKKVVHGGSANVKITGPLCMKGPGLIFDSADAVSSLVGIKVTGSGYTALTVIGAPTYFVAAVYGTGNTCNGIAFGTSDVVTGYPNGFNLLLASVQYASAYKLDGFGVRLGSIFDCVFDHVSVEQCGNASNYAFSMIRLSDLNPLSNTNYCNQSVINQLQVELSNSKAIQIEANTFSCTFNHIHSERQTPNVSYVTWILGGQSCTYNSIRLNSLAPSANAEAQFTGTNFLVQSLIAEDNIVVTVNSTESACFNNVRIYGTLRAEPGQFGKINLLGGVVGNLTSDPSYWNVYGTSIVSLSIGSGLSNANNANFTDCLINTLSSANTFSAATFNNCVISAITSLLDNTVFNDCTITNATAVNADSKQLTFNNSVLNADLNVAGAGGFYVKLTGNTFINGVVTNTNTFRNVIFGSDVYVLSQSGYDLGAPNTSAYINGEISKNPAPAVGSPKSWICTVSGTPGTWVSTGNL